MLSGRDRDPLLPDRHPPETPCARAPRILFRHTMHIQGYDGRAGRPRVLLAVADAGLRRRTRAALESRYEVLETEASGEPVGADLVLADRAGLAPLSARLGGLPVMLLARRAEGAPPHDA